MKSFIILVWILSQVTSQPTNSDSCIQYNANNSICTKCMQGLYLQYFFCIPCNPLCICSSNQNYCQACLNITIGYLNHTSYRSGDICLLCSSAIPNCLDCQNAAACTKCYGGKYVQNGICSNTTCGLECQICKNQTHCEQCHPGYFLNVSSGLCSENICTNNCSICQNQNLCRVCVNEYFAQNGTCTQCIENCQICVNNETCLVCSPSYLFYNGSCQNTGLSNCIQFNGGFQSPTCLVCQPGYYNAEGGCTQCSGCLLCTQAFLCQTPCYEGYYQFNYACLQFQTAIFLPILALLGLFLFLY